VGSIVSSGSDDANPALSSDGHRLFFASPRPCGFGAVDLYQAYRGNVHDDFGWQAPTNLGANATPRRTSRGPAATSTTPAIRSSPSAATGRGLGAPDIDRTDLQPDGTRGPAVAVAELSSSGNDNRPNLRPDGLEIFFYAPRTGGSGGSDLWTATRASTEVPWSAPVNVGATVNTSAGDAPRTCRATERSSCSTRHAPAGSGTRTSG